MVAQSTVRKLNAPEPTREVAIGAVYQDRLLEEKIVAGVAGKLEFWQDELGGASRCRLLHHVNCRLCVADWVASDSRGVPAATRNSPTPASKRVEE